MARLNKSIREAIISNAVKKSNYAERVASLVADRAEWAERLRVESLGGVTMADRVDAAQLKVKKIIDTLPEGVADGLFSTSYRMYPNLGGCRSYVYFNGKTCEATPYVHRVTTRKSLALAADHPLAEEFHALEKREKAASEYVAKLRANVSAMVYSATTVEKLLKVWPEAAELLPKETAPKPQLPAVPLADLNAMIGSPSGGG